MSETQKQKPQATQPESTNPRLGTPRIKQGTAGPATAPGNTRTGADQPLPSRRSLRQNRRADSEAGAPAGEVTKATILELPVSIISPSDVGPLTGQLPRAIYSTGDAGAAEQADLPALKARRATSTPGAGAGAEILPEHVTLDRDGVPVGPDAEPLTRRQLRELRRQQDDAAGRTAEPARARARPEVSQARRAEAPAGAPSAAVPDADNGDSAASGAPAASGGKRFSRESLTAEAAALAEKIQASGGSDPSTVDLALLREQEDLAEKARLLNTGLISQVPSDAPATTAVTTPATAAKPGATPRATPAATTGTASATVGHEPMAAQSAHGLDSIQATEWSARERTLLIVAGLVFLILVVALILAIIF